MPLPCARAAQLQKLWRALSCAIKEPFWHFTAPSLSPPPSLVLIRMSYSINWRGNSGKPEKPPKKEPFTEITTHRTTEDNSWTLMDADDMPSPHPEVGPQVGPTGRSARSSTSGETQYPRVTVHPRLLMIVNEAHMPFVGSGPARSGHCVGFSLWLPSPTSPALLTDLAPNANLQ